ncbi:hypothetical protein EGI22_19830 [Lacihabitans sp. LS3-19]|uniref:M43 family zinc metalloprotease n=1 Tax=Lacihabitans sp. LS3-19 TaxID=2487335 RepID=UPI0020CBBB3D|nr:M43 family zinc metalloprotease [Lacihabitans sp. LS3-19]MCP9770161.1 hypothetical protein [Lacihabitans sp. LS3-19]
MKTKISFSIVCFVLWSSVILQAQINCDTPFNPDNLKGWNIDSIRSTEGYATAKTVRVVFHILRNDDGSNAAATEAYIEGELTKIRNEYQPWNICFALLGFTYINNTTLNTLMNSNTSAHRTALFAYDWSNALNIYCHKELRNNNGTGLIGTAYDIPNTHLSIDIPENFDGVLSHEIGHCLGLLHTFETAIGNELVNGSNCSTAGDLVCDTPADPNGNFNSSTCVYTGTTKDANNQSYNPMVNNLMSYYFFCMTIFTPNQRTRMYDTIAGVTAIGNMTMQTNTANISNKNYTTGTWWGASRNTLNVGNIASAGNVNSSGSADVYFTSNQVRLKPGFHAYPNSNGKVRVLTYGCQF